jgi:uncharacterized glyoxalase superfamily protein PhnB
MIRQIVPQFFTTDLAATLAYYRDSLGFECLGTWHDPPVYAIVARDGQRIHFRVPDAALPAPIPDKYADELLDAYVAADDVDGLFAEYAGRGVAFARGLGDTPWNSREFVVKDCDGRLLAFGAPQASNRPRANPGGGSIRGRSARSGSRRAPSSPRRQRSPTRRSIGRTTWQAISSRPDFVGLICPGPTRPIRRIDQRLKRESQRNDVTTSNWVVGVPSGTPTKRRKRPGSTSADTDDRLILIHRSS